MANAIQPMSSANVDMAYVLADTVEDWKVYLRVLGGPAHWIGRAERDYLWANGNGLPVINVSDETERTALWKEAATQQGYLQV
jgi:hypothetical protein